MKTQAGSDSRYDELRPYWETLSVHPHRKQRQTLDLTHEAHHPKGPGGKEEHSDSLEREDKIIQISSCLQGLGPGAKNSPHPAAAGMTNPAIFQTQRMRKVKSGTRKYQRE